MSRVNVKEYLAYRDIVKKLLLITGVWPLENPNFLYRSLPYVQASISLIMAYLIFGFVRAHSNNINLIIRGLSIMTGFLTTFLKMTCLIFYRQEIYALHELLDVYISEIMKNFTIARVIFKNITIFRRLTIIFIIMVIYLSISWVAGPLHYNIQHYLSQIKPSTYKLIFPTGYPWNVPKSGFIFALHFIFESFASAVLSLITSSIDSLFAFYIFQIIGQLREISYCISLVNEKNNDGTVVRKCVMQYQNLMKCRDIIEKIYGPVILWIMGTSAIILCTVMFQITHMKNISMGRIGLFISWISLKLIQTFIYAWSGSQLTKESENYEIAVYCSKWYGNKNFMRSVTIMLTQKPLILTACNFAVVSLDIFIMILNTTMSYFFLLQALEG